MIMSKTPFTPLLTKLVELLVAESYSERTLRAMRPIFKALHNYLKAHNLDEYTTAAGRAFIDYCENELKMCQSHIERAKNIVGKLDRMLRGIEGRDALLPWPLTKYELSPLLSQLYELLVFESYTESTLRDMRFILNALQDYLKICNLYEYTSKVGAEFIDYCSGELKMCSSRISRAQGITRKLNRLHQGRNGKDALLPDLSKKFDLPLSFTDALDAYLVYCEANGNKHTTLHSKYLVCGNFLKNLYELGCTEIREVTVESVQTAFLSMGSVGYWRDRLSAFLRFLYENGFFEQNYSALIQIRRRFMPMPSVYSPEEVMCVESSFDLTSPSGIRNYAITLLVSRYGIRACDVAALTFDNIDFENNRLYFPQQKTDELWECELLPEVKSALQNYIENVRPDCKEYPNVFMKLLPPYIPAKYNAVSTMVFSQFQRTEIDSAERKRGSRALRSSIASNMINDGISTEIVRKVLGHGTKHALRHYARIDVESMRLCPLPVPEPTGAFARLLFPKGVKSAHV